MPVKNFTREERLANLAKANEAKRRKAEERRAAAAAEAIPLEQMVKPKRDRCVLLAWEQLEEMLFSPDEKLQLQAVKEVFDRHYGKPAQGFKIEQDGSKEVTYSSAVLDLLNGKN